MDRLKDARQLSLIHRPVSPAAIALTSEVADIVAVWEQGMKPRNRGPKGRQKLHDAVGAIIGGLLRNWHKDGSASYRSRSKDAFDAGAPVSYRQFIAAVDGLVGTGFATTTLGIRWGLDLGDGVMASLGKASRYEPTGRLTKAAQRHGVTADTIASDYEAVPSTVAPTVPHLIEVRSRRSWSKPRKPLPLSVLGEDRATLLQEVEDANGFAAEHTVSGCLPPRWKAVYVASAHLGGRLYGVGNEGVYQRMSDAARACITINGEPVTEVDVTASHLTIMHGLLRLPLPEGDLYAIEGFPRVVVKRWVTVTLGKGSPPRKWPAKELRESPELAEVNPKVAGVAICARYPFLHRPAAAVASAAGLDRLADIGKPEALLTHRLTAIEARAINGAVSYLRGRGVLALPVFDSLLVPRSAAGLVRGALDGAYSHFAKIKPRAKFSPPLHGASLSGAGLATAAE